MEGYLQHGLDWLVLSDTGKHYANDIKFYYLVANAPLLFQADISLAIRQLKGRKQNKERITVAFCCNGDGSDKMPLRIIGKYTTPRCFRHVNLRNLGCQYRDNKKAWMTQIIFLEWLRDFDRKMANRKILLIIECTRHAC